MIYHQKKYQIKSRKIRAHASIFIESDCFGNSYPQMGQTSASFDTSTAQPGHSFFFTFLNSSVFSELISGLNKDQQLNHQLHSGLRVLICILNE